MKVATRGGRFSKPQSLILLLLVSILSPLVAPAIAGDETPTETVEISFELFADIDDFNAIEGKPYTFFEDDQPVYSATRHFKQGWVDAGRPGVEDFVGWQPDSSSDIAGARSARACSRHNVGDSVSVPASGGSVTTTVAKTTNTVAFLVQDGRTLSSTILNNWAQTWDQTIYPTTTTYFGKNYGDGRGPAPPDVDNNCQVEIAIIDIDGQYNTGGYFAPGQAPYREIVFVDHADASLSWSKVILAHELEHLLHNAVDPYEFLWVDEGNADMAAFLCFGASSTLTGHSNAWTASSGISVRWWNQRIADYGGGFIFMLYLADHLGGGPAIRNLVADTSVGATAIENLGRSPPGGAAGVIGNTFEDMFANFTIAATLDSSQSIYGMANLGLTDICTGGVFCKIQPAATNSDWTSPWTSLGNAIEGWGVRVFKMTPGSAAPAPLTIRVSADVQNMDGRIVTHSSSDGLYTVAKMPFTNMIGTGLVPGFGNLTDEVWVITWYASNVGDCDYNSCGTTYPTGIVDIEAARITSPASLNLNSTDTSDRDGDGLIDTAHLEFTVLSNAFFEDLDVEVQVINQASQVVDSLETRVSAGSGVPVPTSVWFTPATSDLYSFRFIMRDLLGDIVDQISSPTISLENMLPIVNGSLEPNNSLTWENILFSGQGYDYWGISTSNNTLPHVDNPVAYLWSFGEGNTSTLKSPVRSFPMVGNYIVTLQVQDQGGMWSEVQAINLTINDDTPPIPIITINGQIVGESIQIKTYQRIQFSAGQSQDNVPIDHLDFQWNWGDGEMEGGIGAYSVYHQWTEGENVGTNYTLTLTINDSVNEASITVQVLVFNRLPRTLFTETLVVHTLTPLQLPPMFVDDDGEMTSYHWQFPGGVNLSADGVGRNSDFGLTSSTLAQPWVSWRGSGMKQVIVSGFDDDSGETMVTLEVIVLNQLPVADIDVRESATQGSLSIDFRQSDAATDTTYTFDGRGSFDADGTLPDSSVLSFNWSFSDGTNSSQAQVSHNFTTPGTYTVSLIVSDENGDESLPRVLVVRVANPKPVINIRVLEAWSEGEIVNSTSPRPEGWVPENYSQTFDDTGYVHVAAGTLLWFDSSGTRDGDGRFIGSSLPFDRSDDDWNGLIEYIWDFGDGTPKSQESHPWHAFDVPGRYTVSLTVRDDFQSGDTTTLRLVVMVNEPPIVANIIADENPTEGEVTIFEINATDPEYADNLILWRDNDVENGATNDHVRISSLPTIWWNFDDGEAAEWTRSPSEDGRFSHVFNQSGRYLVSVKVCDMMQTCSYGYHEIEVLRTPDEATTLSNFEWENWRSWLAQAGGESAFVFGLIAAVLILGWLVMRAPVINEEEDAEAAAKSYDVEKVEVDGGFLGMDHHEPPPTPKILSKDERRSKDSAYIRPVRSRRR